MRLEEELTDHMKIKIGVTQGYFFLASPSPNGIRHVPVSLHAIPGDYHKAACWHGDNQHWWTICEQYTVSWRYRTDCWFPRKATEVCREDQLCWWEDRGWRSIDVNQNAFLCPRRWHQLEAKSLGKKKSSRVSMFSYLWSTLTEDGKCKSEIEQIIWIARKTFVKMSIFFKPTYQSSN